MKTKHCLYILFIVSLFLPLIQYIKPFAGIKELNGWQQTNAKPSFSAKSFLQGDFQYGFELYYNDNAGFHPSLVRLRNQIYYTCFNTIFHDKTLVGKNGCFYEKGYINNALFGMYSSSQEDIKTKSYKLYRIQDTLTKMGKEFLFVFAPGKGTYYKENIPKRMFHVRKKTPPHLQYMHQFDSLGVNYIDFDKWFLQLKERKDIYPLYAKNGIHYNKYGCYMVIDSLSKYFNKKFTDMPQVVLDSLPQDYDIWENEYDCFESANLMLPPQRELLAHPYFHYTKIDTQRKKCIFMGDSYIWVLILLNFNRDYFCDSQYWYYFNDISYSDNRPHSTPDKTDILQELKDTDVLIVMFTNSTTPDQDNGFTDKVYSLFFENK